MYREVQIQGFWGQRFYHDLRTKPAKSGALNYLETFSSNISQINLFPVAAERSWLRDLRGRLRPWMESKQIVESKKYFRNKNWKKYGLKKSDPKNNSWNKYSSPVFRMAANPKLRYSHDPFHNPNPNLNPNP